MVAVLFLDFLIWGGSSTMFINDLIANILEH